MWGAGYNGFMDLWGQIVSMIQSAAEGNLASRGLKSITYPDNTVRQTSGPDVDEVKRRIADIKGSPEAMKKDYLGSDDYRLGVRRDIRPPRGDSPVGPKPFQSPFGDVLLSIIGFGGGVAGAADPISGRRTKVE